MKRLMLPVLLWLVAAACASSPEAEGWPALTRGDVEAAYRILHDDHPGASREAGDDAFRANLESARRTALSRAERVSSLEGYAAVLAGFANSIGDRHVSTLPLYRSDTRTWAGLMLALRNGRYVVASDATTNSPALVGATLISCDGVDAAEFARDKLGGFRAVWSVEAQRVMSAPFLLIDEGNPFVLRPQACRFEQNGVQRDIALEWRSSPRAELSPLIRAATGYGEAGYGVRDFAGGVWVSIEGFDNQAEAVIDAARSDSQRLRRARIVVVDLRGNAGGNDVYGRYLAEILFGAERVDAILGAQQDHADCGSVWRASARNERRLVELRGQITDAPTLRIVDTALAEVRAARARGADFGAPVRCADTRPPDRQGAPPQAASGRIVVLTDSLCFSSCLSVTNQFRRLGAMHAGHTTNANTHYSEVRVETLPSGLSVFSTLQAIITDAPREFGPFEPELPFDGNMADTPALEAWITENVSAR